MYIVSTQCYLISAHQVLSFGEVTFILLGVAFLSKNLVKNSIQMTKMLSVFCLYHLAWEYVSLGALPPLSRTEIHRQSPVSRAIGSYKECFVYNRFSGTICWVYWARQVRSLPLHCLLFPTSFWRFLYIACFILQPGLSEILTMEAKP